MMQSVRTGAAWPAHRRLAALLATVILAGMLAACAGTAVERFYHLDAVASDATADYDGDVRLVIQGLPDAIDRPQIVLQDRPNEVAVLENDRWAEPVRSGFTRILVQDLGHALPRAWVSADGPARDGRSVTVFVQVDRMAGGRSGTARLVVRWLVRGGDGAPGVSNQIELQRDAPGTPAGIVAAWSEEIATLAQAIARSLPRGS